MKKQKLLMLLAVTIAIIFAAGTAQADVLLSVDHDNLPDVGNPVLTWECAGILNDGFTKSNGAPTVVELGGEKWYSNVRTSTQDRLRHNSEGHGTTPIPINGATIVAAVRPTRDVASDWSTFVDFFYDQLCLGIRNESGQVIVKISGASGANHTWRSDEVIPEEPGVLTLTVGNGADPAFEVFWQGADDPTPVSMGTGNGNTGGEPYTALYPSANGRGFAQYINIGGNNPDGWSVFTGLIGDTIVFNEQLSPEDLSLVQEQVLVDMGIQESKTQPANGDLEVDSLTLTELSWLLPYDPNVGTEVTVWFGDQQIDDNLIVDGVIGKTSITLDDAGIVLDPLTEYTWHIEFNDPNVMIDPNGIIMDTQEVLLSNKTFTFTTLTTNQAPEVVAPDDFYTWLEDGIQAVENVTAVITDPDGTSLHSYTWSVVDGPDGATVGFSPNGTNAAAITDATFTVAGDYVLQVEVNDNDEYAITGTVNVKVYEDGCAAAKAERPYSELNARAKGDTNYDCEVNLADLATMALNWLGDVLD